MSGRGRGNWSANKPRGGSAGGYSYFNKPHAQSGGGMDQGWDEDRWGYHGYQYQQWSAGGEFDDYYDEDMYTNQMGWQNFQGGMDFSNGSGRHSGFHVGGGMDIADRKRPREGRPPLLGRAPKRRQRETNYYGGFNDGAMGRDYGGFGGADADWMQGPSSSGWGMGAGDYYEEEYLQQLEYGGYSGGKKQGRRSRDSRRATWNSKKDMLDHADKRKKKHESPDDKLLYSKHRNLTQMDEKRNFMQAVRGVMSAIKCASETLSVEAKAESQVAEFQQHVGESKEQTNSQETDQTEKETKKTGEESDNEEKNDVKTEGENDKTQEENDKTQEENDAMEKNDVKTETEDVKTEKGDDVAEKEDDNTGIESDTLEKESNKVEKDNSKPAKKNPNPPPQVITGVIRVGPARRKLMVKDATDHGEEVVAVFKEKPRKQMIHRLASLIEFNLKGALADKAVVSPDEETEMITVNLEKFDCKYPILISLTSPEYSDENSETTTDSQNNSEFLSKDKCCLALSKIRRIRWRKKVKEELELPIVRIFMDFARRLPGWQYMSSYAAEVMVHSVMDKLARDVREMLAAGLVLTGGPGLKDPCEAGSTDIFGNLKPQEAEDLTEAAQLTLRMHACGQLKKLLDV